MGVSGLPDAADVVFQCSSASRKFLNFPNTSPLFLSDCGFSALQRAENSSMYKIIEIVGKELDVSVLFSEPKIPQLTNGTRRSGRAPGFSALQRAENSSIFG